MKKVKENNKKKAKKMTMRMQIRFFVLACTFSAAFLGMVYRIFDVAFFKGAEYKKRALTQQTYVRKEIKYRRGNIQDRKGVILAHSISVYNLILEPYNLTKDDFNKMPTLNLLHEFFDLSIEELERIVAEKPNSKYTILKRDVSFDERAKFMEKMNEFNNRDVSNEDEKTKKDRINGVWFEEYFKREYPRGKVASDVVGFTNAGDAGSWGVEEQYNEKLNGRNGKKFGYFNSDLELEETELEAKNGYHVITTLDSDAQKKTEDIIDDYIEREGAKNVGILIMNPNNGEIYVMASNKQYDLNEPRSLKAYYTEDEIEKMTDNEKVEKLNEIWKNFCISYSYEPGSTFKPFTVSACLDQNVTKQTEKFLCDGFAKVADRTIHCVKRDGHGAISLSESLEMSCNDVMMQISAKLGRKEFARYQSKFGIGTKTGVDLPGESTGIAYTEEGLNPVELATCSFGQGVSTTMIQIAAGISSIINGGTYYRPRIVKELTNDAGLVVERYAPVRMKKTVTKKTADFIKKALYKTVEGGTGKRAKSEGYKVGGKTGTAQKIEIIEGVGPVRSDTNYILSFVGFAPYDKPEALAYVVVDEPKVEEQARSGAASLLAGEVITKVFPIIGVYPEKSEEVKQEEN